VLARIVNAESRGKTTAKNPESTAHGAGQLLNEMWKKMGGGDRQDAETQVRNAAKLLRSNTDNFRNATGRNPSASEAYVTWVLGDSTGRAVLAADPSASVEDVIKKADPKLGNDIIKKNASIFKDKSVGDVTQWAANKTKLPSAVPVATATAAPAPKAAPQDQGIAALTSDPATGFSVPQDVFSPSPEEERKYAAAQAQAKKNADVVSQIPGQSVKAPAYKDTNTYFGGIADEMGIPLEAQRNIANTINATSGYTAPIGGINRAASTVSKGLEPTAEMLQKAEQAKLLTTSDLTKKIVEAPSRFKDEPDNKKINRSGHEVTQYSSWSDYIIEWSNYGVTPTTGATSSYKYKLNRRSGVLEFIVFSNFPTLNQKLYTNSQFNCLKQDKKF
jgi:hypothetical protein